MSEPAVTPRLAVVAGPGEGEVVAIEASSLTIGRRSASGLQLVQESVSRDHCMLQRSGDAFVVRDLDSLCGTFVNGIPVRERRLAHGDFLRVGESIFLFLEPRSTETDGAATSIRRLEGTDDEIKSTEELSVERSVDLEARRVRVGLEDRDRGSRHLAALLDISNQIHGFEDRETLARDLAQRVLDVIPARRVAILLVDGEDLEPVHSVDRDGEETPRAISDRLCRRVLAERIAVLSNDPPQDLDLAHGAAPAAGTARCVLCVPLTSNERTLGVIYADASSRRVRFDREQLELLTAAARIAGSALEQLERIAWLRAENRRLRRQDLEHEIVGESEALAHTLGLVARVAPTDLTVLVLGETGTGKELIAKAIHRNSPRADRPFVAINCATLSENLLESELFGHERGAFTGAVGRKVGQFEIADGGTLFLDEVGEIPEALQARLLRALEAREIRRVGGAQPIPIDVRVVAATNRDLERAIRQGTFREDLYHRLNVFALALPPLRARGKDVSLLANHFAARAARRLKRPVLGLARETQDAIAAYDWPGNVRELQNAMERAVVLATESFLLPQDLPEAVVERAAEQVGGFHQAVTRAKRDIVRAALREAGGAYGPAAASLGLNRTYLHRLVTNLGLRAEDPGTRD